MSYFVFRVASSMRHRRVQARPVSRLDIRYTTYDIRHPNTQYGTPYSCLSAATGSNLAARMAGSIPKTTPVTALAASAWMTAEAGVDAGIDGHAVRTATVVS